MVSGPSRLRAEYQDIQPQMKNGAKGKHHNQGAIVGLHGIMQVKWGNSG